MLSQVTLQYRWETAASSTNNANMLIRSLPKPSELMIFYSTKRALRENHSYHIHWKYHTQHSVVVEAIGFDTKKMETVSIRLCVNRCKTFIKCGWKLCTTAYSIWNVNPADNAKAVVEKLTALAGLLLQKSVHYICLFSHFKNLQKQ